MPTLKKEDIEALTLDPAVKADLLNLFTQIDDKENELTTLRTKVPKDTEKVVSSVDFEKYQSAVADLDRLKQELAGKMEKTGPEGENLLTAFAPFFG